MKKASSLSARTAMSARLIQKTIWTSATAHSFAACAIRCCSFEPAGSSGMSRESTYHASPKTAASTSGTAI